MPIGALLVVPARYLIDGMGIAHGYWARLLLHSEPDPELTAKVVDARSAQARIIAAADAERRRIERDLHDGAQQRLVALSLKLGMARKRLGDDADGLALQLVDEAQAESRAALEELRDLARGIHPAVLTDRGLAAALRELAVRATVPTEVVEAPEARLLPRRSRRTAYFVVAECLTNVGKYAQATSATVRVRPEVGRLVVEVVDDGVGGADAERGSGLRGLADRVGALSGTPRGREPPGPRHPGARRDPARRRLAPAVALAQLPRSSGGLAAAISPSAGAGFCGGGDTALPSALREPAERLAELARDDEDLVRLALRELGQHLQVLVARAAPGRGRPRGSRGTPCRSPAPRPRRAGSPPPSRPRRGAPRTASRPRR